MTTTEIETAEMIPGSLYSDGYHNECPEPIRKAFLRMLMHTFLGMRNNIHPQFHAAVADHLHNVPDLLNNFHVQQLGWYLDSREWFLEEITPLVKDPSTVFARDWAILEAEYRRLTDCPPTP